MIFFYFISRVISHILSKCVIILCQDLIHRKMKTLFNLVNSGVQKFSFWENERAGLKRNLARIKDYYRRNPTIVPSQHFLVRLLQSIAVPHSINTERYYDNVVLLSNRLSSLLGMTSSISKGKLFKNTFYNGSHEILLSITERIFDIEEVNKNWKDISAVKVVSHPVSTLDLMLPDGRQETVETGIAIISIDIPLLALQYRAFCIEQEYLNNGAQLTIMQFIRMYVIPNTLDSHLDYVIFNRIKKLYFKEPIPNFQQSHPFILVDYSNQVDGVLIRVLSVLEKQVNSFSKILLTLPAITNEDQSYLNDFPSVAITRQIGWALVLSKISVMGFLASISSTEETNVNVGELNRFINFITINNIEPVIDSVTRNTSEYGSIKATLALLKKLQQ